MSTDSFLNNGHLVDGVRGEISREIFVNNDIYAEEREKVFGKAWLYVGHESQIRRPGDFFLSRMGEESVILTRDKSGKVQVLLNSCRHRGMRVCRYDEGHTDRFYCPYHGWSYKLDGSLLNVTEFKREYDPNTFEWDNWGLVKVAKIATIGGAVWATWDKNAPDFDTYLGGAKRMLDHSFRAWDGEGEIEILGTTQKWTIPSNWKIVSENFSGDMLHVCSHRSVDMVGVGPNKSEGRRDNYGIPVQASYAEGHGGVYHTYGKDDPREEYSASKITAEYFQDSLQKRRRVLGEESIRVVMSVGTIFPNMSFHAHQPRTILAAHPDSVGRTTLWRWYFVDKDAPSEVKQFLRRYYIRYSGPAGMTEQDDMENWNFATSASEGYIAKGFPYNYQAGMESGTTMDAIPGATVSSTGFSEINSRGLYQKWSEYMGRASSITSK